jgi:hypothetical protein
MLAIPHPYDPPRHTGLQQHLTVTIPSQSGPRPDLAATQPMAGADLITTPIPAPVTQDVSHENRPADPAIGSAAAQNRPRCEAAAPARGRCGERLFS